MNFFERKAQAGMSPGQDDLVERVVRAMVATELDCAGWHPDALKELARAAIDVVLAQAEGGRFPRRSRP